MPLYRQYDVIVIVRQKTSDPFLCIFELEIEMSQTDRNEI